MLTSMEPSRSQPGPTRHARREPSLGQFDDLQFRPPAQPGVTARLKAWNWRWLLVGLMVVIALLLLLRQPLADWLWPDTRAQRLHEQAAQALAAGKLTAPDGSGARELYEAALALDPDRIDARDGLNRVGQAALAQARAAMAHRQYAQAHQALALAEDLSIPRAQIDVLREQLRQHEAASTGIEGLLQQAATARAEGRLDGNENAALPLYQRVLDLQPRRTEALEGREDTLSDLLQQARKQFASGDLVAAAAVVRRVQGADPSHVELPDALAELTRAAERRRDEADSELARKELGNALEGYRAALQVNPEDALARRGIIAVAAAYAQRSERLAADFRFDEAQAELAEARAVATQSAVEVPAIDEARQHIARARQAQRQMNNPMPTAQRQKKLAQLLADARQAEARGDLLTPPGDSAFDKLGSARAIAPMDPRVKAAAARLAPAAARCFREALSENRLVRAGACLDARRTLEGDNAAVREARRELAQRWIAMGDQRLGAGEVQGAQAALNAARALDPAAEGLRAFAERVRAASVTGGDARQR
jgi:hypothetical protein